MLTPSSCLCDIKVLFWRLLALPRANFAVTSSLCAYKYGFVMQSIRAGVIKANNAYKFILPESWSEQKIANIQSGNFCMVNIYSTLLVPWPFFCADSLMWPVIMQLHGSSGSNGTADHLFSKDLES